MIAPAAVSTPLPNLLDLTPADLVRELTALGQPAYRARQVLHWVYQRLVDDFAAMTDLPQALRRELAARFRLRLVEPLAELTDPDGTRKVLLGLTMDPAMAGVRSPQRAERWRRFNAVESVLMVYRPRGSGRQIRSVCVSTQVGCAMNCPFCATGQSGFVRDLTAGEIVAGLERLWRASKQTKFRLKQNEKTILELPVAAGLVGALLAPEVAVLGAVAALFSRCTMEVVRPVAEG